MKHCALNLNAERRVNVQIVYIEKNRKFLIRTICRYRPMFIVVRCNWKADVMTHPSQCCHTRYAADAFATFSRS